MRFLRVVKFDIGNILKNPMLIFFNAIFPGLSIIIFGFLTKGIYGKAISSYDYYGVSLMIYSALMECMIVANVFMEKSVIGGNLRIAYAPLNKSEIYLSKIFSSFLFAATVYTVIMVLEEKMFHINLGGSNMWYFIGLVILFTFFMCCFTTMICCVVKSEEVTTSVIQPIAQIFALLGGLFFPVSNLGKIVTKVSVISPVKWITECSFKIIYDNDFSGYWLTVALLIVASTICVVICEITFKPEEYV